MRSLRAVVLPPSAPDGLHITSVLLADQRRAWGDQRATIDGRHWVCWDDRRSLEDGDWCSECVTWSDTRTDAELRLSVSSEAGQARLPAGRCSAASRR